MIKSEVKHTFFTNLNIHKLAMTIKKMNDEWSSYEKQYIKYFSREKAKNEMKLLIDCMFRLIIELNSIEVSGIYKDKEPILLSINEIIHDSIQMYNSKIITYDEFGKYRDITLDDILATQNTGEIQIKDVLTNTLGIH